MDTLFEMARPTAPVRSDDYESWLAVIRPAFVAAAASGRAFTTYEVVVANNLPEPPDTAHQWGSAVAQFHREGLFEEAGFAPSARPKSGSSILKKWVGAGAQSAGAA